MIFIRKTTFLSLVGLIFLTVSFAQVTVSFAQELDEQYNPNSIEPIAKYEHMFKKRVWMDVNLKEKQNKGFFAKNGEITQLIITAVESGELSNIYTSDSLENTMTKEEFFEKMVASDPVPVSLYDQDMDYYEGDEAEYDGVAYTAKEDIEYGIAPGTDPRWVVNKSAGQADLFLARQISIIRIMEDRIFDKRRSRLYYKTQSIELIVPGTENSRTGLEQPLGVFKYKDLVRLFRNHPKEAVWLNRYNSAENKNFADAFLLRLFHGSLVKVENPDDEFIVDNPSYETRKEGIMAAERIELELMEKEHHLWEF
ncbi:MAG: gliding motility protein GldN [Cyclobacteriaceae bacterium]|nr:gliding motility protein GldN [Cyclobacteriaceae bacterium]